MVLDTLQDTDKAAPESTIEARETEEVEAVKARLQKKAQLEKLSMKSIGRLAGLGASTLSAWLGGNYAGNSLAVAAKIRIWLDQQEAMVRTRAAMPTAIPYTFTRTAKAFEAAIEYAQTMADISVVVGGPGVGKTTVAEQYCATHSNAWYLAADPSANSAYALLDFIVDMLGIPETSVQKRSRAIALKLRDTQGVLIIDEAQHLSVQAIEQLRSIHDRAKIGLVLMGNEEVWNRLDGGGRKAQFAQLFSRVGAKVTAARPRGDDIDALLDAADVDDGDQRKLLKAIAAKPGALRQMIKTLRLARMVALGNEEELSREHIDHAWTRLSGAEAV